MIIFIPRISQASEEILAADSINEKTCTQIGMIANDASKDSINYSLLSSELNSGTKILVDDKYYISGVASNPITITENIYIEGTTDNAEFSFTNTYGQKNLFNIQTKEVIMKKLRFTQLSGGYLYAFNINNVQKLDNFIIEHCYFEGNIRLLTWSQKVDSQVKFIDPTVSEFGITHFVFNYNTCRNLKQFSKGFIYLDDVPISHAELIGNDIKNFLYAFYTQGITNENPYRYKISEQMKYLEVKDNVVTCDNAWEGSPLLSELYHCFVLFEGNKCDYFNNHVEGLHVLDQDTAVYDAYLSCWDLDYENNYWKNNICFYPKKQYGDLMKSKSANKSTYHGVKRLYKNNTYIVEKSYADVFKRSYDELWVSLSYYQREMDTVIVENNNFDVYKLGMNYGQPVHNYTFSDNKIHAYATLESRNNCILPVYRLDNPAPTDIYTARNNKIIIDTPSAYTETMNSLIMAVGRKDEVKQVKIIFENNYVEWPDLLSIISSPLGITPIITNVRIANNTVVATRPGTEKGKTLYTGIYGIYKEFVFDDNTITIPTNKGYQFKPLI